MSRCECCNATIVFGGKSWGGYPLCSDACVAGFQAGLARAFIPAEDLRAQVAELHAGDCPACKRPGPTDVYTARRVTGMLLAVQWSSDRVVGCAACGRALKLKAFLHCLFLGWWSPKALVTNLFFVPYNVLSALLFTRSTAAPSPALEDLVCQSLAVSNDERLLAIYRERRSGG